MLSNDIKITKVKAGQTAGTSEVNGSAVDMADYDGCLFFATMAVANAGNYLKVEQGEDSEFAESEDLEDSQVVAGYAGEVLWVDVYRPLESQGQYLRATLIRGSSTATGDIYALQYKGRIRPEDNLTDDVIDGVALISPDQEEIT